jgi:hypothetical protein
LRKAQNANLKWMLEAAAEKLAASTQQLRAKIRGLGGEPVSTGLVNGAISLDDQAILLSASVSSTWRKTRKKGKATWHNSTIRRRRQTSSIGQARTPDSSTGGGKIRPFSPNPTPLERPTTAQQALRHPAGLATRRASPVVH